MGQHPELALPLTGRLGSSAEGGAEPRPLNLIPHQRALALSFEQTHSVVLVPRKN